jgi:hypothetical protein
VAVGCAKTDSDDILTRGMYADIKDTSDGASTTVSATLYQGPPHELVFIELTGDDQLIAKHGTQSKVMSETQVLNVVSHHATFTSGNENDAFDVEFRRIVDDGAPKSTATLPAGFTIAMPPSSVSRAGTLPIDWSPSGTADAMSWSAEGSCIETASGSINGDPGNLVIAASTLKLRMNTQETQCNVTVRIDRRREGSVDPAFEKGGESHGVQRRSFSFTSTP